MSNKMNTPWYSLPYTRDYATVYTTKKEALIATMQAEYAAHIVRCANTHDEAIINATTLEEFNAAIDAAMQQEQGK